MKRPINIGYDCNGRLFSDVKIKFKRSKCFILYIDFFSSFKDTYKLSTTLNYFRPYIIFG